MQTQLALASQFVPKEISVGANECRLARQGERLVARGVLADVVLTIQVPAAGFAAMLRFSIPEETNVSRPRLEALWDFTDEAIDLLFQSIRSMNIPSDEIRVSAMGGADVSGRTFGRGKQLAMAVRRSLWQHGVMLNGNDLGGTHERMIWLESASNRLIVRSKSTVLGDLDENQSAHNIEEPKAS